MRQITTLLIMIFICTVYSLSAQNSPYFLSGNDPKPSGKKWVKIEDMSDEFNGTSLNTSKWKNTDPTRWKGRPPGLFMENTVSVENGELKITNYQFDEPFYLDGKRWTHACGLVRSKKTHTYGYYECKMKANKTFLSSTFWLINYASGSGCNRRVTELDIQECVGEVTGSQYRFGTHMISHTHHRISQAPAGCQPNASSHKAIELSTKPYERYYVYGVWWKNKDQALFYLDGVYQYTVNLPSDFNIPMFLNMVTETYDWNPTPANGGMTGSAADRTTSYQWVRSWQLEDGNTVDETVALNNAPTSIPSQTSYTVNVNYTAAQARDVVVEFWSPSGYIDAGRKTVAAGRGIASVDVNLDYAPTPGAGYIWKASIRPVGTNWQQNLDNDQVNNVTVVSPYSDEVNLSNAPTNVISQTSYTLNVQYEASQNRDIVVEFWSPSGYIDAGKKTVAAGTGIASVDIELDYAPNPGSGYIWKASIRPIGANWQQNLDNDLVNNITVVTPQLIPNGKYAIKSKANNHYLGAPAWSDSGNNYNVITVNPGSYDDQRWQFTHLGNNIYSIKLSCCNRYLEVSYASCTNGSNVSTWLSPNNNHQKWKLSKVGNDYMFKPLHCQSKAMDRQPNSGTSQTKGEDNVHLWATNSANSNQLWQIIPDGDALVNSDVNKITTVDSESQAFAVEVYPNPIHPTGTWFIDMRLSLDSDVEVKLFDITGKQIYNELYKNQAKGFFKLYLDNTEVQQLNKGIYLLKIRSRAGEYTQRLIVQ